MNNTLRILYKNANIVDDAITKLKDPAVAGGTVGAIAGGLGGAVTSPENASKLETVLRVLLGAGAVGAGGYAAGSALAQEPAPEPKSAEEKARDRKALESRSAARTEDVGQRAEKAKDSMLPKYLIPGAEMAAGSAAIAGAGLSGQAAKRDLNPVLDFWKKVKEYRDGGFGGTVTPLDVRTIREMTRTRAMHLPWWEKPAYKLLARLLIRK